MRENTANSVAISLGLHGCLVGLIFFATYLVAQQAKDMPVIFELVAGPPTARAEVMGDFTDWKPLPLENVENSWWRIRVPLEPGVHEMNIRVDGREWTVPRGLVRKSDEFGGAVGVFVVEL